MQQKPSNKYGPGGKYEINTDIHKVKEPARAAKKYTKKLYLKAISWICFAFTGFLIWLFVIIPVVKTFFSGQKTIKTYLDMLFPFLGFVLPLIILYSLFMFFRVLKTAEKEPMRETAPDTIRTFIEAVTYGFWEIGYNCLTDTAQKMEKKEFPADIFVVDTLSKNFYIHSLKDFKTYWQTLSNHLVITWFEEDIVYEKLDERTILFRVAFKYRVTLENEIRPFRQDAWRKKTRCVFVAKKIWKYWFLCNGFLIPESPIQSEL
jgi:hypothetical protein